VRWQRAVARQVKSAAASADTTVQAERLLASIRENSAPVGSYPVVGWATISDWEALLRDPSWKSHVKVEGIAPVHAPTTLGRIEVGVARSLVARSYLNTYRVSLFFKPLGEAELDRLGSVLTRINKVVGLASNEESATGE
jgi:hypothetical protein